MAGISQDLADKAEGIGSRYFGQVESIRGNGDLTAEARQRRIAQAYSQASSAMAELKSGWEQSNVRRQETLTRDLFGSSGASGADAISFRDALDRAAQIETPEEAARILARAQNTGDTVLARAVAQAAYEQMGGALGGPEWVAVVNAFAEKTPTAVEKINELSDLQANGPSGDIMTAMHFHLSKPNELDRMTEASIEQLANAESAPA